MTRDEMVEIQVASTVLAAELGRLEQSMLARLERVDDLLRDMEVMVRNFPNDEAGNLEGLLRSVRDAGYETRELRGMVGGAQVRKGARL